MSLVLISVGERRPSRGGDERFSIVKKTRLRRSRAQLGYQRRIVLQQPRGRALETVADVLALPMSF